MKKRTNLSFNVFCGGAGRRYGGARRNHPPEAGEEKPQSPKAY